MQDAEMEDHSKSQPGQIVLEALFQKFLTQKGLVE
jgi:hypothetical protein